MAVQNFSTYDLIVDLVPGVLAVFLLVPLFPAEGIIARLFTGGQLLAGVYVLILGYGAGRNIHDIGSIDWIEARINSVECRFFAEDENEWSGVNESTPVDEIVDIVHRQPVLARVPAIVKRTLPDLIREQYGEGSSAKSVRKAGEARLYGEDTLYRKYEILSTFYRSIIVVTFGAAMLYYLHLLAIYFPLKFDLYAASSYNGIYYIEPIEYGIYQSIWYTATSGGNFLVVLTPFLLTAASILAIRQRRKYIHRRERAFLLDFYEALAHDDQ